MKFTVEHPGLPGGWAEHAWRGFPDLLCRRFPNRHTVEIFRPSAGLEARDTPNLEVRATIRVRKTRAKPRSL